MAGQVIRVSLEEFEAQMRAGGSPTPDDVGVKTFDGRHLKTKEEIWDGWLRSKPIVPLAGSST